MDAGDADEEAVVVALDDDERVVALLSLRVRPVSTRASGRERAATGDDMASPPLEGLFINENKYQLSPASKRLLQ